MRKTIFIIITFFLFIPLIIWGQIGNIPILEEDMLDQDPSDSEENINLRTIDLYWSTDSYVPFGYQGRALPVKGSSITVEVDLDISGGDPL